MSADADNMKLVGKYALKAKAHEERKILNILIS